jgi:hypothetical protein
MIESYGNRRNDDYLRDVSRGAVVGARNTGGYGEKVTSGADSGVLWSNGTYSFPPAAGVQLSVVSTSANDTAAGTGVRQIVISSAVSYSEIPVGHLRESAATRMVPKGKKIFVTSAFAGSISGTAAAKTIVRLGTPTLGGFDLTTSGVFVPVLSAAFQDSSGGLTVPCPIPFTEGQTIGMTFETDKAATVIGSWSGYMENIN